MHIFFKLCSAKLTVILNKNMHTICIKKSMILLNVSYRCTKIKLMILFALYD